MWNDDDEEFGELDSYEDSSFRILPVDLLISGVAFLGDIADAASNLCNNLRSDLISHSNWVRERNSFHETTAREIESLPTASDPSGF